MHITPKKFLVICVLLSVVVGIIGEQIKRRPFLQGVLGNLTAGLIFIGLTVAFFNPIAKLIDRGNSVRTEKMSLHEIQLSVYTYISELSNALLAATKKMPKAEHDKYLPPGFFPGVVEEYRHGFAVLSEYYISGKMSASLAHTAKDTTELHLGRVMHMRDNYLYAYTIDSRDRVQRLIRQLEDALFWFSADVRDLPEYEAGKLPKGIRPSSSDQGVESAIKAAKVADSLTN